MISKHDQGVDKIANRLFKKYKINTFEEYYNPELGYGEIDLYAYHPSKSRVLLFEYKTGRHRGKAVNQLIRANVYLKSLFPEKLISSFYVHGNPLVYERVKIR